MHTADCFEDKIYVFRGGDGRDYLNDLHELNTQTLHWKSVVDIKRYWKKTACMPSCTRCNSVRAASCAQLNVLGTTLNIFGYGY